MPIRRITLIKVPRPSLTGNRSAGGHINAFPNSLRRHTVVWNSLAHPELYLQIPKDLFKRTQEVAEKIRLSIGNHLRKKL